MKLPLLWTSSKSQLMFFKIESKCRYWWETSWRIKQKSVVLYCPAKFWLIGKTWNALHRVFVKTLMSVDVFTVSTLCSPRCAKIPPLYCLISLTVRSEVFRSFGSWWFLEDSADSKYSIGRHLALLTAKYANVDLLPGIASVRGASRAIPWVVEWGWKYLITCSLRTADVFPVVASSFLPLGGGWNESQKNRMLSQARKRSSTCFFGSVRFLSP